jgi:hypothetical protein
MLLNVAFPFTGELVDTARVSQETRYVEGQDLAVTQGMAGVESEEEEEEEEEAEESRGDRFKTERTTIVSLKAPNKSYGNIPDSLGMLYCQEGQCESHSDTECYV